MKKGPSAEFRVIAGAAFIAASVLVAGCSGVSSRDEFTARVKDKSEQEVSQALGKPNAVDSTRPERVTWTYTSRTFNLENGNKLDPRTIVVFAPSSAGGLKVKEVVFAE